MNITRRRGDTYADVITVTDLNTGLPVNILGYLFNMTLDPSDAPTSTVNNLYSLQGTILDAAAGSVSFAPSSVQADQIPATYFFDIQMVDASGLKRTIASGKYLYMQDICKI
jgi:hypothetical protein